MSVDPQALDPYRPPPIPEAAAAATPSAGRPGLLTLLCVLCIVLGTLGLLNTGMGMFGAIAGPALQKAIQPKPPADLSPKFKQAQDDFQQEITDVQRKFFWFSVPSLGLRFVAALLL